jgi:NADH-quinone oxidoreductase subunit K
MSSTLVISNGFGLFLSGVMGFSVLKSDVILLIISLEVILLGVNLVLLGSSSLWDDAIGQVFVLFVLTVAAAEAAIGLAILVVFSKVRGGVDLDTISLLHG